MKKHSLVYFIMLFFPFFAFAEIRNIAPPKLQNINLGDRILSQLSVKNIMLNMYIEKINKKIIAHNYGHGEITWSLAPGAASYVNGMLINFVSDKKLKKNTPITILGAGIVGLFTAYNLKQRGFSNVTIITNGLYHDLFSRKTNGIISTINAGSNFVAEKNITEMLIHSYKFYKFISTKENSVFKNSVVEINAYFDTREESGLEAYVEKVIEPAKDVIVNFDNGVKRKMVVYDKAIFVHVEHMVRDLLQYLKKHNVTFIHKKINHFSAIKSDFIINCSNIMPQDSVNDNLAPKLNQYLTVLNKQESNDLPYVMVVNFNQTMTSLGRKIQHSFYFFPYFSLFSKKVNQFIGGVIFENNDINLSDEDKFEIVIKGANNFYYGQH